MGNFKIRVVENIGEESINCFGEIGNELEVVNEKLEDLSGDVWIALRGVDGVNALFGDADIWQTVFELAE